jgi:hypothetical protein
MKTNKQKNILKKMCKQGSMFTSRHFLIIVKKQINFKNKLNIEYSISKHSKIKMFKNNNIMFYLIK